MDTLMQTKKLEGLGFERSKAEGLILMIKESIEEQSATKSDLKILEIKIQSDLKVLSRDLIIKLGTLMITMTGIIIGVLSGVISVYLK
jgi:hypothetical protein